MINRYLWMACFVLSIGCTGRPTERDLEKISLDLKIERFDSALFRYVTGDVLPRDLQNRYPDMLSLIGCCVLETGDPSTSLFWDSTRLFLSQSAVIDLYRDELTLLSDLRKEEQELTKGLKRYLFYFPNTDIPRFYIHFSALNQSVIVGDRLISIAGDKYLGKDYSLYLSTLEPFARLRAQREYMVPDLLLAFLKDRYPKKQEETEMDLLEAMIYYGKILYCQEQLLPDFQIYQLLTCSQTEYEWCIRHEQKIWRYLLQHEYLFQKDPLIVTRFVEEGPASVWLSQEAPAKIGVFIGSRIVASYVRSHDLSLPDLMTEKISAQQLLERSGYRP